MGNIFVALGLLLLGYSGREFYLSESAYRQELPEQEAAPKVHTAPSDRIDPALEGKLVHITAPATVSAPVRDPEFGVAASALRLERQVQQYGKSRSGKRSSYEPKLDWVGVSEGRSRHREVFSNRFFPEQIRIGPLVVSTNDHYVQDNPAELVVRPEHPKTPPGACWVGNVLYLNGRPKAPLENDRRVIFRAFPPMTLSAVGVQRGDRLEPRPGYTHLWMHKGVHSLAEYLREFQPPPPPGFQRYRALVQAAQAMLLLGVGAFLRRATIKKNWEYPVS